MTSSSQSDDQSRSEGRLFGGLKKVFSRSKINSELKESLEEVIEEIEADDGTLGEEERSIIMNTLSFGDLRVDDVMVPRADIVAFVPPSMKLIDLLTKMQRTRIHMALVVDEYGGTDGLLTIEDLVEQIVGDIEDEHDITEGVLMRELSDGKLQVDARLPINELEDLLGIDFLSDAQDDDVDTIGGLVFTLAGHIPQKGDIIAHENGVSFEIVEGDSRRIKSILLHRSL
ncbi:transporter associated domain-containing protein [Pseudemcibacter aquimaris]|uniref:transporter associated domain-containing protein n=1 Tax=Pseudemcibacter aquimaris TaxID=2857064 RepID=UPI00201226BB|nr:transporter associated domain-containing protein [Pseudemcibacter aquimaris]MCC3862348.1 CBS domain-containing protein [Pseudemcibacter aquimaris]WDU59221.1 CBS domain-containing protein [Pseudemcibacter aquimaris]